MPQVTHLAPFHLREHGKRILRGAIWNDTKFLQSVNVMDYSLLVGVDDHTKELVLGIVDYIRTFTWDKRFESWVKDLGGAGGKTPTIVTPKQYKQRFRSAMERYFPLVQSSLLTLIILLTPSRCLGPRSMDEGAGGAG